MDCNPALSQTIASRILTSPEQRITFAEYMEMVLYYPEQGYYATDAVKIGFRGGDFFTAVSLGADFGELLAVQFLQMWDILGQPKPFHLVEMGAGQGLLAFHILSYLKIHHLDFFIALEYVIVEKSPCLKQEQQKLLQDFCVRWCDLEEIPPNSITGCLFSNELVDAFPVHQFTIASGKLQEIYVTISQDLTSQSLDQNEGERSNIKFIEVVGEASTPQLAEYLDLVGIDISQNAYEEGYRSEINLAAWDWLSIVADCLHRGYVLTIDYGYPASRYYHPRRSQGTLQCYYQHRHHNNPYINIGKQDITAHVDFTALEQWGKRCGLNQLGWIEQGLFLMALGLGERIAALSYEQQSISQILKRRQALHQLISPEGLGNFGVLVQSQGLTPAEVRRSLQGLTVPE